MLDSVAAISGDSQNLHRLHLLPQKTSFRVELTIRVMRTLLEIGNYDEFYAEDCGLESE